MSASTLNAVEGVTNFRCKAVIGELFNNGNRPGFVSLGRLNKKPILDTEHLA
jgi:hypothetical protein